MTDDEIPSDVARQQVLRTVGTPNSMLHEFDFWDGRYEGGACSPSCSGPSSWFSSPSAEEW